jgi:hypothetical protein
MKRLFSLAAVLALAFCSSATAQQAEKRDAGPRAEGRAAAGGTVARDDSLFDRLDANQDGYLSAAELEREPAERSNWIAADRNGDGRISREEFAGISAERGRP